MTTPSHASVHAVLLRDSIVACAMTIQGPDALGAPADNARRTVRHIAFAVHDLITRHPLDSVAIDAGLARDYARHIAHDTPPAATGIDRDCARTVHEILTMVEDKIQHTFTDMRPEHAQAALKMLRGASALVGAVQRWGANADAERDARHLAKAAAAHLTSAASALDALPPAGREPCSAS